MTYAVVGIEMLRDGYSEPIDGVDGYLVLEGTADTHEGAVRMLQAAALRDEDMAIEAGLALTDYVLGGTITKGLKHFIDTEDAANYACRKHDYMYVIVSERCSYTELRTKRDEQ